MFTRKVGIATIVPALLSLAATVHASPQNTDQQCIFEEYAASAVQPYKAEENVSYGTYTVLRGAQVYVPARAGLTAEWLNLNVQRALAQQSADAPKECRPSVKDVQVQVVSAGAGFWVFLSANDERSATTLLSWAKTIVHPRPAAQLAAQ